MKCLISVAVFLIMAMPSNSQYNPGARQIAMANADVAGCTDLYSIYSNPAGLAGTIGLSAAAFYSPSPFGMKELSYSDVVVAWHGAIGAIAAGFMQYGFELYRESTVTLACAFNAAEGLNSGISVNYRMVSIQNYGTGRTIVINAGCQYSVSEILSAGFCINNILRSSPGKDKDQLPVSLDFGLALDLSDGFAVCAAAEKELKIPVSLKIGAEWLVIRPLALRYGISTQPDRYTAGAGITYGAWRVDYAVYTHTELGLTHQFDVVISLQ